MKTQIYLKAGQERSANVKGVPQRANGMYILLGIINFTPYTGISFFVILKILDSVLKEENFDLEMNSDNIWRSITWITTQRILIFQFGVVEIDLRAKVVLVIITVPRLQWPRVPPVVLQPRQLRMRMVGASPSKILAHSALCSKTQKVTKKIA